MYHVMTFGRSIWLVEYPVYVEAIGTVKALFKVGNLAPLDPHQLHYSKTLLMKIKNLPQGTKLEGLKVKTAKGVIGYYINEGVCIVFLATTPKPKIPIEGRTDETRLYPQIVSKQEDIQEWDVITDDKILVNCKDLTSHKYTMCVDEYDSHD